LFLGSFFFRSGSQEDTHQLPVADYRLLEFGDSRGLAKQSLQRAAGVDTHATWVFNAQELCDSVKLVDLRNQAQLLAAHISDADQQSMIRPVIARAMAADGTFETRRVTRSVSDFCSDNQSAEPIVALSTSRQVWEELRNLGVQPMGIAVAVGETTDLVQPALVLTSPRPRENPKRLQ
jgi:hypothetical protein